jgi:hypothetical protein
MKQTKNTKLLYFIFLICVIPTIYVYLEHAIVEKQAHDKATSETKKIKTLAEFYFFFIVGFGYISLIPFILIVPQYRIPYIVLIIGTIVIVIFYYLSRIYPIPIPFTEQVIRDVTMDWRDVVTKIAQQILVVPIAMLLMKIHNKKN